MQRMPSNTQSSSSVLNQTEIYGDDRHARTRLDGTFLPANRPSLPDSPQGTLQNRYQQPLTLFGNRWYSCIESGIPIPRMLQRLSRGSILPFWKWRRGLMQIGGILRSAVPYWWVVVMPGSRDSWLGGSPSQYHILGLIFGSSLLIDPS